MKKIWLVIIAVSVMVLAGCSGKESSDPVSSNTTGEQSTAGESAEQATKDANSSDAVSTDQDFEQKLKDYTVKEYEIVGPDTGDQGDIKLQLNRVYILKPDFIDAKHTPDQSANPYLLALKTTVTASANNEFDMPLSSQQPWLAIGNNTYEKGEITHIRFDQLEEGLGDKYHSHFELLGQKVKPGETLVSFEYAYLKNDPQDFQITLRNNKKDQPNIIAQLKEVK